VHAQRQLPALPRQWVSECRPLAKIVIWFQRLRSFVVLCSTFFNLFPSLATTTAATTSKTLSVRTTGYVDTIQTHYSKPAKPQNSSRFSSLSHICMAHARLLSAQHQHQRIYLPRRGLPRSSTQRGRATWSSTRRAVITSYGSPKRTRERC
jgi:hypothetical protein